MHQGTQQYLYAQSTKETNNTYALSAPKCTKETNNGDLAGPQLKVLYKEKENLKERGKFGWNTAKIRSAEALLEWDDPKHCYNEGI